MNEYLQFLETKKHTSNNLGIIPNYIPDGLFDFQKYVVEYAVKKGRCAIFLDTGTGKTFIELVIATNFVKETNKPVLILTPLAVGLQMIREAEKFGINDVGYTRDGKFNTKIVICNYERLHLLNPDDYSCVICDESSRIKNDEGVTRKDVTTFLKKVKYRFLFTATPSPNDFIELGTSSEALGYMGYTDMITRFFKNNEDTVSPMNIGTEWVLKGHAKDNFFKWVSGWSISMRRPSDLGFSDEGFSLPELFTNYHTVSNNKPLIINNQHQLFNIVAKTQKEINAERSATITERCEKAVELANDKIFSVYWCNLTKEGCLLERLDKKSVQVDGSMSIDEKEEKLLAFANGEIKHLITKPKITCFGLNWQHCNHTTVFPTFSWEQYYQLIRRFYRYGQKQNVTADLVVSDGMKRILDSLIAKATKTDELFTKLNYNIHQSFDIENKLFDKPITLPSFL